MVEDENYVYRIFLLEVIKSSFCSKLFQTGKIQDNPPKHNSGRRIYSCSSCTRVSNTKILAEIIKNRPRLLSGQSCKRW